MTMHCSLFSLRYICLEYKINIMVIFYHQNFVFCCPTTWVASRCHPDAYAVNMVYGNTNASGDSVWQLLMTSMRPGSWGRGWGQFIVMIMKRIDKLWYLSWSINEFWCGDESNCRTSLMLQTCWKRITYETLIITWINIGSGNDLDQHWLRYWFNTWRHQATNQINVGLSSIRSHDVHLTTVSQEYRKTYSAHHCFMT